MARRRRAHRGRLSPLRDYPLYRRLWIGQAVTFLGSEIALVALPFQLCDLTHSTLALGCFPEAAGAAADPDACGRRGRGRL